jgi:phage/conjugal plasmid C-4 type zinc finger TraR family protein
MDFGERQLEAAQAMVVREAATQVERIRAGLAEEGEDVCVDCDEPIGAARKAALPSAERCIDCQIIHERKPRD